MLTDAPAQTARSILERPARLLLWLDGHPNDIEATPTMTMHDWHGTPEFRCPPGHPLVEAARGHDDATLVVTSNLHPEQTLTLTGTLRWDRSDECFCCGDLQHALALDPREITLDGLGERKRIPVDQFADPRLQLNEGFLAGAEEHLNIGHGEEIRAAAALRAGVPDGAVIGAQVRALSARGVVLDWVGSDGAHRVDVGFDREARNGEDLEELLTRALHQPIG